MAVELAGKHADKIDGVFTYPALVEDIAQQQHNMRVLRLQRRDKITLMFSIEAPCKSLTMAMRTSSWMRASVKS
ncbi:MAG: hypothetical protein R2912_11035 [Eubacteriales bacterium]